MLAMLSASACRPRAERCQRLRLRPPACVGGRAHERRAGARGEIRTKPMRERAADAGGVSAATRRV